MRKKGVLSDMGAGGWAGSAEAGSSKSPSELLRLCKKLDGQTDGQADRHTDKQDGRIERSV